MLDDKDTGDVEVFVNNGKNPVFDGVTTTFVTKVVEGNKTFAVLIADGDIFSV